MNNPAPKTSPDAALGNLMAAALDVPAPDQPKAPDDTLARTGNTADHQAGWFAGMEQGQANTQDNAAIHAQAQGYGAPAEVAQRIEQYIGRYGREDTATLLLYEAMNALRRHATAAGDTRSARDSAFEAVRKRLCALPRYSFWQDDNGGVKRVNDRSGNWIEFDAAHELFDPVCVDAAIAAQRKGDA